MKKMRTYVSKIIIVYGDISTSLTPSILQEARKMYGQEQRVASKRQLNKPILVNDRWNMNGRQLQKLVTL